MEVSRGFFSQLRNCTVNLLLLCSVVARQARVCLHAACSPLLSAWMTSIRYGCYDTCSAHCLECAAWTSSHTLTRLLHAGGRDIVTDPLEEVTKDPGTPSAGDDGIIRTTITGKARTPRAQKATAFYHC